MLITLLIDFYLINSNNINAEFVDDDFTSSSWKHRSTELNVKSEIERITTNGMLSKLHTCPTEADSISHAKTSSVLMLDEEILLYVMKVSPETIIPFLIEYFSSIFFELTKSISHS